MDFENDKTRLYFLTYAFTSFDEEHKISDERRNEILTGIKNGKVEEGIEEEFTTALVNLAKLSQREGKEKIDEQTIENYFVSGVHNKFSKCKAYRGIVMKLNGKGVIVQTPEDDRNYRTDLEPKLEVGNVVIVHGNYVIKVKK
jgi:hypothetical protein